MLRVAALTITLAALLLITLPARSDDNVVVATVTVSDIAVEVAAAKHGAMTGRPFQLKATVLGAQPTPGTLRLHLDSESIHVHGGLATELKGGRREARWQACADVPGRYIVMASLETPDGTHYESAGTVLVVGPSGRKAGCPW
jgi:hypothetical protein